MQDSNEHIRNDIHLQDSNERRKPPLIFLKNYYTSKNSILRPNPTAIKSYPTL